MKQKTTSRSSQKKMKTQSETKERSSTSNLKKRLHFVLIFLSVFFLDQVTKHFVQRYLTKGSSIILINNFFGLTYTLNTGVSFGLFKGMNLLFIFVSVIALGFFLFMFSKKPAFSEPIAMVCGGIVGNLIDRIGVGAVIDFIHFNYFAIFNVADSCICIGIIWLITAAFIKKEELF